VINREATIGFPIYFVTVVEIITDMWYYNNIGDVMDEKVKGLFRHIGHKPLAPIRRTRQDE